VLLDPDERKPKRRKITKFIGVHNCKPLKGVDFSGRKELCNNLRSRVVKNCDENRQKRKLKTVSIALPMFETKSTGEKHVLRMLFDSGSEGDIMFMSKKMQRDLPWDMMSLAFPVTWGTSNGTFKTSLRAKMQVLLPEFSQSKLFELEPDVKIVKEDEVKYDLIVGVQTMAAWGVVLDFKKQELTIDEQTISLRQPESLGKKRLLLNTYREATEPAATKEETERVTRILDAKYEAADLPKIVAENCAHLDESQQAKLLELLQRHEEMFQGKLGKWVGEEVSFELKEGERPWQGKPYPIPKIHEDVIKKEVDRLVEIDVLEKITSAQSGGWGSPSFIIAKSNGQVRFLSDLREVNKRIVRKPFPLPKISDTLQRMEKFQWASAIDLNMGYYHLTLDMKTREICSLIFPWGRYRYKRLPMGAATAPDVFQEKMNNLFNDLEYIRVYIDDLLVISADSFDDHLEKLSEVLQRLHEKGFQVNAAKSNFCALEVDYLGYTLTRDGIVPQKKKVAAILALKPPTNVKQLRRVLGIVQYYRDIWEKRTDLLAPLTDLVAECGTTKAKRKPLKPWRWDAEHQEAFEKIKNIIARDVVLAYPDFKKEFLIYTDASTRQLGGVITQDNRPIAFFSRKLTKAQEKYTVTELELLSIVELLKEFKGMLLGYKVKVMTDHVNLTSNNLGLDSDRVLRWRLLLNEYDVEIDYIKGVDNTVADAISRLDYEPKKNPHPEDYDAFDAKELNWHMKHNIGVFILTELLEEQQGDGDEEVAEESKECFSHDFFVQSEVSNEEEIFPVTIREVVDEQLRDKEMKKWFKTPPKGKHIQPVLLNGEMILCFVRDPERPRMVIPKKLQRKTIAWYHHYLQHPGRDKMMKTLSAVMYWKNMDSQIRKFVQTCERCQKGKKRKRKYATLPPKQAVITPWHTVCVDCCGPYEIKSEDGTRLEFMCLTMVDPATGWFEVVELPTAEVYREFRDPKGKVDVVEDEILDRTSAQISQLFNKTWLCRYPRPVEVVCDNGSEFKKDFKALLKSYSIKRKPTTIKNPQANAIVERIHGVLGDMMRTSGINNLETVDASLIDEFLTNAAWAIRSTHHSVLQATPGQAIFGRDMLFDIPYLCDWSEIGSRRQQLVDRSNARENKKRVPYDYTVGQKAMIIKATDGSHLPKPEDVHEGPYEVTQVFTNGTVRLQRGAVNERLNVRRLTPYFENDGDGNSVQEDVE